MSDDLEDLETPKKGHNSVRVAGVNNEALKSIVERVERINDTIAEHSEERKEIFSEAKGNGLNVKTVRRIIAMRKKRKPDLEAELAETELYMMALGML